MKDILTTTILITWVSACFATGQVGESVIYRGDTLIMLSEPLEIYLQKNEPRERFYPTLEDGCSTALWRGYVGLWEIKDNRLILLDIFACGDRSMSIKNKVFKEDGLEIFASWFTGKVFLEKGRLLKYNHIGYDRYYENEIVVTIQNGNVHSVKEFTNGVKPDDNRFTRDINIILGEIYKRINWNKLPKISNKKRISLQITLDKGKIVVNDSLIDTQKIEDSYKEEIKGVIRDFPEVQVFYSRGEQLKEGYYGMLIFSRENRRKYAP